MARTYLFFFMLFVARQATANSISIEQNEAYLRWQQLIDAEKDLTVYFNGGFRASSVHGLNEIQTKWAWGRPGVEWKARNIQSGNVSRFLAEGEVADTSLTSVYLEQKFNSPGHSYTLRVGQFLNLPLRIWPEPVKRMTLGAPDATRRFSGYTPGGMLAFQREVSWGHVLAELSYFERSKKVDYDSMFADFPKLENGKNVRKFSYHLELQNKSLGKLEIGGEQDVGHIFALSGSIWPWMEPRIGMSTFQRQSGAAPLNVFFAENTVWVMPAVALVGRLDFGHETEEMLQAGAIWKHHGRKKDGLLGLFWQPSTKTISLLLSGAIKY